MKPERIPAILKAFEDNADRVIMIDGCWGIGKTYQLLAHIRGQSKADKKKKKYVYVSMFGKETIDDIHTELYTKMYPGKKVAKMAIRMIPKVAPLIVEGVDLVESLSYALKTEATEQNTEAESVDPSVAYGEKINSIVSGIADMQKPVEKSKIKKRKKVNTIVIFDDFERLDFEKISIKTLMGYLHSLILQQIKLVIACNEKEILKTTNEEDKTEYKDFREKVFDRRYAITASDEDVMRSYWGEDKKYLEPQMIEEFQHNIRLSERAAHFYKEIKCVLDAKTRNWYESISSKMLIWYSICIIVGAFSDKYKKYYQQLLEEAENENEELNITYYSNADQDEFQGDVSESVGKTKLYVDRAINMRDNQRNNRSMGVFIGLCKFYYHNDDSDILNMVVSEEDVQKNPLLIDVSFMSQEEKYDWFKKQESYILDTKEFNPDQFKRAMGSMCTYGYMDDEKMTNFVKHIVSCSDHNCGWLHEISVQHLTSDINLSMEYAVYGYGSKYQRMIEYLVDEFARKEYRKYLESLDEMWKQRDYSNLERNLRSPSFFSTEKNGFKPEVIELIRRNNYFIIDIGGSISEVQWTLMRYVRTLAKDNGFWEEMQDYIRSIEDGVDLTIKKRKASLLGK